MFIPYGSLLGVGSEDAAFLKALASIPLASSHRLRFSEGQSAQRKEIVLKPGNLRVSASLPQLLSGNSQRPFEDIRLEKQQGTRAD